MNNMHKLKWLRRCFESATRDKANKQTRILICDDHDNHVIAKFINHCRKYNIILLILSFHFSHIIQSFNVVVFESLKKHMIAELQDIIQIEILRIQKTKWLSVYVCARVKAFFSSNIFSTFSDIEINFYFLQKIIHWIRKIEVSIEDFELSSSESEFENLFSLDFFLISSSFIDAATYQIVKTALKEYIHQNLVFSTSIKIFVDRYINSLDRVWVRNFIIETKYNKLKKVSIDRKRHEIEIRTILKKHHVITDDDVFEKIVEAQSASRKRKVRKERKDEASSSSS